MSLQINLSQIEENPEVVPEQLQKMAKESLQILWQLSQNVAQDEIKAVKERYKKLESEVLQKREEALEKVTEIKKEIAATKQVLETIKRENKSLEVDQKREKTELKSLEDKNHVLQEKLVLQEQEIKHLTEQLGAARQHGENLQKRLQIVENDLEKVREKLTESNEELAVSSHNNERLEKNIVTVQKELDETWKQLKVEERKAAVAEALVEEMKQSNNKHENEIKALKTEQLEKKASIAVESKAKLDQEKKVASLTARLEIQEKSYKDIIKRLEQELTMSRAEASNMRNRVVKAEGGLEREKRALERLENKLIAASNAKV
jgi:chromosome segregation ATPase